MEKENQVRVKTLKNLIYFGILSAQGRKHYQIEGYTSVDSQGPGLSDRTHYLGYFPTPQTFPGYGDIIERTMGDLAKGPIAISIERYQDDFIQFQQATGWRINTGKFSAPEIIQIIERRVSSAVIWCGDIESIGMETNQKPKGGKKYSSDWLGLDSANPVAEVFLNGSLEPAREPGGRTMPYLIVPHTISADVEEAFHTLETELASRDPEQIVKEAKENTKAINKNQVDELQFPARVVVNESMQGTIGTITKEEQGYKLEYYSQSTWSQQVVTGSLKSLKRKLLTGIFLDTAKITSNLWPMPARPKIIEVPMRTVDLNERYGLTTKTEVQVPDWAAGVQACMQEVPEYHKKCAGNPFLGHLSRLEP